MTVTVRSGSRSSIAVGQGGQSQAAIVVKRAADVTIQTLNDVNSTDLADGYTLVYDEDTGKFVTQPLGNVTLNFVDGGTY